MVIILVLNTLFYLLMDMLFNLFLLVNICFFVLYLIIEIHIDEGKSFNFSFRPEAFSLAKSLYCSRRYQFISGGNQIKAARRGARFSQCAHVDTAARPLELSVASRPASNLRRARKPQ